MFSPRNRQISFNRSKHLDNANRLACPVFRFLWVFGDTFGLLAQVHASFYSPLFVPERVKNYSYGTNKMS